MFLQVYNERISEAERNRKDIGKKGTIKFNIIAEVCAERETIIVKFRETSSALYWNNKKGTLRARPNPSKLLTLQRDSPNPVNFLLFYSENN